MRTKVTKAPAESAGRPETELDPKLVWLKDLYEAQKDAIYRYAASRVGVDEACDLVADTFVEAISSRASYDPRRGSEAAWLFGIATNVIRRVLRDQKRRNQIGDMPEESTGSTDPRLDGADSRLDDVARSDQLRQVVSDLPAGEQEAFLLFAVEDLTVKEVAVALSISPTAAKLRIFRARRRLGKAISQLDRGER